MSLKIGLIFIIYISAEVCNGYGLVLFFPCKTSKIELTDGEKEKIQREISEFIDLVTLNEIATLWKESKFHYCFNKEITDYNLAIMDFKSAMATYSNKFWGNTKHSNHHLVEENYQHIRNISDLMEKARNETFLQTQDKNLNEGKLKGTLEDIKKKIQNEFLLINQIYFSIKHVADTDLESQNLKEAVSNFKTEVEKVKSKSKEFIGLIKKCLNVET